MNVNFKSTNGVQNEDPHFNNVSLLLHMDGANNSEVFLDSSPFNKTISPFASPKISASIKKFGTGAGSFDGATQYLIIPNNGFDFGTGDFTVEFWAYKTSGGDSGFVRFFNSSARWSIELGDGPDRTKWGNGNGEILFANGITQNQWVHVAFTRHNGTLRVFFDGIQQSSVADNFNYTINGSAALLGQGGGFFYYPGYLDEFRITKGVARYTGNFTPPTTAFLDTSVRKSLRFLKSNDGKKTLLKPVNTPIIPVVNIPSNYLAFWKLDDLTDSSSNGNNLTDSNNVQFVAGKIGNCAQFNGTNHLQDNSLSSPFNPNGSSGEFAISCWVNPASFTNYQAFLGSTTNSFIIHTDSAGTLYCNEAGAGDASIGGLLQLNQWQHIVFVKSIASGDRTKVWYNGSKVYDQPTSNVNNYQSKTNITLGNYGGLNFPYNGRLDMVGLWNRELTQVEIDLLYNSGNGREP